MIHYKNKDCSKMTEQEISACSQLFSENYGVWSNEFENESKRGQPIRMSPSLIRKSFVEKPDRFVALIYDDDELIGQAFYLRRKIEDSTKLKNKFVTIVLQLVVKKEFRGKKYGTKLLHSIWGLSDVYAWGIYTSNPLTLKALEDSTLRKISPKLIMERKSTIKSVVSDIFDDMAWFNSADNCRVNTKFFADHSRISEKIKKFEADGRTFPFEMISEGEEWLALIFKTQQPTDIDDQKLSLLTETSHEILQEAYSKMDLSSHGWAKHTEQEVTFLVEQGFIKPGDKILDLGCGNGRHVRELRKRGFDAIGVDFSKHLPSSEEGFVKDDILHYKPTQSFDVVLCLYDVIGSYSSDEVNAQIINKICQCLRPGGIAVVSVMNMELTEKVCKHRVSDVKKQIHTLLTLPPSLTMQKTGDIFNGNYLLIDEATGVVYRREQFINENSLPVEYIVPDRRYTKADLTKFFSDFTIQEMRYVQAGKWETKLEATHKKAKEVLAVFKKKPWWKRFRRLNPDKGGYWEVVE